MKNISVLFVVHHSEDASEIKEFIMDAPFLWR
jgi:hypothetical protein